MKYFSTTLGKLASTLDDDEKTRVEKLALQFLSQHCYFSWTWKVLDIIVSGKGVILYEKSNSIDSLNTKSENGVFFSKDKFSSMLKGTAVGDDKYSHSKILYTLLKMRDLSDLNDLYNAQNVIILCEIMENKFQTMYVKKMHNSRKCNSASKLRDCIQREQSKIVLALPTKNSVMEIF